MWSLKMLKCCVCCEHPSNGKSMMGRALRRSQGCYIKAEVLHQRLAGSKYWCLFGFVGLFKSFSLVSSPFTTGNAAQFPFLPLCLYLRLQAFYSTTLYIPGMHERLLPVGVWGWSWWWWWGCMLMFLFFPHLDYFLKMKTNLYIGFNNRTVLIYHNA